MENSDVVTNKPLSKKELFANWMKKWAWLFAICAGLIALVFLFTTLFTYKVKLEDGTKVYYSVRLWQYFNGTYKMDWTMITTLVLLGLGIVLPCFHKFHENFLTGSTLAYVLCACFLILSREFFKESNGIDSTMAYGVALAIAFSIFGAIFSIIGAYSALPMAVEDITEEAMLIALAFGLNFLKISIGATGGSINFQMLPLIILALRRGPLKGFIAGGIVFGLLTCFTDGYGFASYPFDYLIGFGSVAVAGFFSKFILVKGQKTYTVKGELWLVLAVILVTLVRFTGSTASSMVLYGYDFAAACLYNALYIPVSSAAALIVLMAIYGPLCRINTMFPVINLSRKSVAPEE
jgi:thiamine transporter